MDGEYELNISAQKKADEERLAEDAQLNDLGLSRALRISNIEDEFDGNMIISEYRNAIKDIRIQPELFRENDNWVLWGPSDRSRVKQAIISRINEPAEFALKALNDKLKNCKSNLVYEKSKPPELGGTDYLIAKKDFEKTRNRHFGGKKRLSYRYKGGMENLTPFSTTQLRTLDHQMPGSWNFEELEKQTKNNTPLNKTHPKYVWEDIKDRTNFLEAWIKFVLNTFKPNNPNITIEIKANDPELIDTIDMKIFDENSLADAIESLMEWDETENTLILRRWFKKIVKSKVTLHGGRFVMPNNNPVNQPPNINLMLYVDPYNWEQLITHPIQSLNLNNYNLVLSLGNSAWPENESISIYGLNINNITEQLPELIQGINVLKKFFARTMAPAIRKTQIKQATISRPIAIGGNNRKKTLRKLRWTYS
tara:strand:- start:6765 stop:8033 length:1269 start_codon:yes stop_codon:yes gene_type:complete